MIARASGLATQYFLNDHLSVRVVMNTNGSVIGRQGHLPFGEDFGESGTQEKHQFTSYEQDSESGSDYAVNRHYSPRTAKFISVDPIHDMGFKAAGTWSVNKKNCTAHLLEPRKANRFAYTWNDPVNNKDPLGLSPPRRSIGDPCWENAFSECLKREAGSITDLLTQIGEAAACAGVCIAAAENALAFPGCIACMAKVSRDLIRGSNKRISTLMIIQCWSEANGKCPHEGGGGGGNAEVPPDPGSGLVGDAYGFGATSSFLNWLYSITPEGEDHLA
jgi:RHS repeat-associated protein